MGIRKYYLLILLLVPILFSVSLTDNAYAINAIPVSLSDKGQLTDGCCGYFAVSNDGNFVYFHSHGNGVVSDDTNSRPDLFLRDLQSKKTIWVSESQVSDTVSSDPTVNSRNLMSDDGRYIAFASKAKLVEYDNDKDVHGYLFDRIQGTLKLLPVDKANEVYAKNIIAITPNGKYAIISHSCGGSYFCLYDLTSERVVKEIDSNDLASMAISGDSRYFVFRSEAINDVQGKREIYRYDIQTGNIELISTLEGYSKRYSNHPTISYDGRFVAFMSKVIKYTTSGAYDSEFEAMFLYDSNTKKTEMIDIPTVEGIHSPVFVSQDGRYIAFIGSDMRRITCCGFHTTGLFVYDTVTKNEQLIVQAINADFSSNGDYLVVNTVKSLAPEDTGNTNDLYLIKKPLEVFSEKLLVPKDAGLYREIHLYGGFAIAPDCTGAMQIAGRNEFSQYDTQVDISVFYPDDRILDTFQTKLDNKKQFSEIIPLPEEIVAGNYKIQMNLQGSIFEYSFYYDGRTQTHESFLNCISNQELTEIKKNITFSQGKLWDSYLSDVLTEDEYNKHSPFFNIDQKNRPETAVIKENLNELRAILNKNIEQDVEDAFSKGEEIIHQKYSIDDQVEIVLQLRNQKDSIISQEKGKVGRMINDQISYFVRLDKQEQKQGEAEQARLEAEQKITQEKQELKEELLEKYGEKKRVPEWIKNNAKWWAHNEINDKEFVNGLQHLIEQKIISIPDTSKPDDSKQILDFVDKTRDPQHYVDRYNNEASYKEWFDKNYQEYTIEEAVGMPEPIPGWIKNNADWWSQGLITEDDFVQGIEFLVKNGIIRV